MSIVDTMQTVAIILLGLAVLAHAAGHLITGHK
jgi:hypothetical protein